MTHPQNYTYIKYILEKEEYKDKFHIITYKIKTECFWCSFCVPKCNTVLTVAKTCYILKIN